MAVSYEKHSFWSKDRPGSSWLTERLLVCQEVTSVTQQHVWYVGRQEEYWHAWVMSFVWTPHLATLKDNFIIFAAFLSEILVTALIAQFASCWTQYSRARYARIGEEGASNPDVCHAQNRNPATQCIILFASAILCLSCTTLPYKKICGLGLLVIVAPQPFNTGVICVRNRSRQLCMWSKEVDCFWQVTRRMTLLCRQKDVRARGCGRCASGQVSATQLPHSPPTQYVGP